MDSARSRASVSMFPAFLFGPRVPLKTRAPQNISPSTARPTETTQNNKKRPPLGLLPGALQRPDETGRAARALRDQHYRGVQVPQGVLHGVRAQVSLLFCFRLGFVLFTLWKRATARALPLAVPFPLPRARPFSDTNDPPPKPTNQPTITNPGTRTAAATASRRARPSATCGRPPAPKAPTCKRAPFILATLLDSARSKSAPRSRTRAQSWGAGACRSTGTTRTRSRGASARWGGSSSPEKSFATSTRRRAPPEKPSRRRCTRGGSSTCATEVRGGW